MKDGSPGFRLGKAVPTALQPFIKYASSTTLELALSLRVQLGADGSYVAWAGPNWTSFKVPSGLSSALYQLSSVHIEGKGGTLKSGSLDYVAWHNNGSYYLKGAEHSWKFQSAFMNQGWNDLWRGYNCDLLTPPELADLAYVAIDPHSQKGDTFMFIKKQQLGIEPAFVLKFESEDMISRVPPSPPADATSGLPQIPHQVVSHANHAEDPQHYHWAFSKRAGRPHPKESWELELKRGERVKVIKEMGRDWYVVLNRHGVKGWVHSSWLDFRGLQLHADPREAYARWTADTEKMLTTPGTIRNFPHLASYLDACAKDLCKAMKQDSRGIGICVHDLHELLRGSGQYSLDHLKAERNKWHPDKFARFCHPESRDDLKPKAEALFVLFGVLMDWMENPLEK